LTGSFVKGWKTNYGFAQQEESKEKESQIENSFQLLIQHYL